MIIGFMGKNISSYDFNFYVVFRWYLKWSPHSSLCEKVFSLVFVLLWIWSCFCVNREKISFPSPHFWDFETVIWGLTSLTDFCKRVHLFIKKRKNISKVNYMNLFENLTPPPPPPILVLLRRCRRKKRLSINLFVVIISYDC